MLNSKFYGHSTALWTLTGAHKLTQLKKPVSDYTCDVFIIIISEWNMAEVSTAAIILMKCVPAERLS